MTSTRPRRVLVVLGGLVIAAAVTVITTTREIGDDAGELPRQVEARIDGRVVQGWTLGSASCPAFDDVRAGSSIECAALATGDDGARRTANATVTIARCHGNLGNLVTVLLGQDDTRDCVYDYVFTIQPGPGRGDGA